VKIAFRPSTPSFEMHIVKGQCLVVFDVSRQDMRVLGHELLARAESSPDDHVVEVNFNAPPPPQEEVEK